MENVIEERRSSMDLEQEEMMLEKMKNPKVKKWIEYICVCAIIGLISGLTWSDSMVQNLVVIIITALVLAVIRVAFMFWSNSRK